MECSSGGNARLLNYNRRLPHAMTQVSLQAPQRQARHMGAFWIRRGLFEHARRVVGLRGHVKNAEPKLTGKANRFTSNSNLALAA